jgi:hypothetical protein
MDGPRRSRLPLPTAPALAVLAAVTVLAAVAGCASGQPPRSPRPAATTATPQARARSVIAQDVTTLRWSWLVGQAEAVLTARCMKSHGFTYTVPAPDPEPAAATITVDALGTTGPATYGIPPHHAQPTSPGDDQPSFAQALEGPSTALAAMTLPDGSTVSYQTGGCTAAARATLFGSLGSYMASAYVPQVIRDEFDASLTHDKPYTTALKAWQACMADHHWTFDGPEAAISSLESAQLDAATLSRRQSAIAAADRDCDSRSGLRSRRGESLARFTAALPGKVLAELDGTYLARQLADQVARRTVSSS